MSKSKRYPHKIPHNTGNYRPTDIIFFDTETAPIYNKDNSIEQVLKLYVFKHIKFNGDGTYETMYSSNSRMYSDIYDYLDSLSISLDTVYLCSHNLIFDFTILHFLDELDKRDYELIQFYSKQLASQFTYSKGICTYIFFDTVSLFPTSIKRLGKVIGLNKLDIDLDINNDELLFEYCNRDVDILIRMFSYWYKFLNDNDFGDFRTTLASTAFSIYRHKYMNIDIDIHCKAEVNELERKSYKGGRVELFFKGYPGYQDYYKLDVNSMYPYVMMVNKFPIKLIKHYKNVSIDFLKNRLSRYSCIAHCLIKVNDNAVSTKVKNRNIYPIGTFETYLTTPELDYVLENGEILEIYSLAVYSQDYIFTDFVKGLYNIRLKAYDEDNQPMYLISKLIMNSLYGKFGQINTEFEKLGFNDRDKYSREYGYDATTLRHFTITTINHTAYIEYYGGESTNSFPGIAAHVTAYARLYLYQFMRLVNSGDLFYCDTDSLIVNRSGYEALKEFIDDKKLGALKLEGVSNRIVLYSPKDYRFGTEKKLKGISKSATKLKGDRYTQLKWQRFGGIFLNDNPNQYYQKNIVKELRRIVYSGKVNDKGYLEPWHLPEDLTELLSQIKKL